MRIAILISLLLYAIGTARAGGTLYWEIQSQAGLLKGEARGVALGNRGQLLLAPKVELVFDTEQPFVWCTAADSSGNIYVGTGHEGKVFKLTPSGAGKLFYRAQELDVTALATDPAGNLYAGTSPSGKVYRITPDGKSTTYFDPEDTYIWSLAFRDGALYVATGSKGRIYRVDPSGQGRVFYETNESNVVSIALDRQGDLVAGTDPSGLVLRIDAHGKAFALFDSSLKEIHSVQVGADGNLYALGINESAGGGASLPSFSGSGSRSSGPTAVASSPGVSVTITNLDPLATTLGSESSSLTFSSAIYRISPAGGVETIWSAPDRTAFCLTTTEPDRLLVGTNDKGRIYQINSRGEVTVLGQSSDNQVSDFVRAGALFFATSTLGRVYRLSAESAASGEYDSPVLDAKFVSQWGSVGWREESAKVEFRTRSGNTSSPDTTWSEWSAPVLRGARITSPPGRFLQYQVRLTGDPASKQASVEGIRIAYLPENVRPQISSFEVLAPGVALQETPQPPIDSAIITSGLDPQLFGLTVNPPPRKIFQRGARSLQWSATDPNGDSLSYQLLYRSVTEQRWHILASNISNTWYTVDADALADGLYFFKLVASDSPSNAPGRAATNERVSELIEIDTTPPTVRAEPPAISGHHIQVGYQAEDVTSNISRAEVSIDGAPWQSVLPVDGIADSRKEQFVVKADFDAPGEHSIALRVYDTNANIGSHRIIIRVQ